MRRPALSRLAVPGYALTLALLITGPLLGPGYLLLRDAVSTPRSYLSDAALGLTEAAPRALPQDFLVAVGSPVLDGGMLVKTLLVAGLWLAGWGAARLAVTVLPETGRAGQFVAATVALWNPYVAERLLQGHWSLLVGYGCLPWVAAAVLRLRSGSGGRGDAAALLFWIALAGLTPTGVLLALVVAAVAVAAPGPGRRVPVLLLSGAAAFVAALPWLLAAALANSLAGYQAGADGWAAFAARAEPGLGTLGSLAGLAGIWNSEAVPASRSTGFALLATVVLLTVVAVGIGTAWRHRTARPLLVLAAVAVLAPALAATGAGQAVLTALSDAAPGLGILRDGQKWVALAVPGYAVAAAASVTAVSGRWPALRPAAVAAVCCAAVVAVLPDLAWGVGGRMTAVHYPPGWSVVAEQINAHPQPVAVLPSDPMRQFAWSGPTPVLDPLPRWVRAEVLSTGDLAIADLLVLGEGSTARQVQQVLLDGGDPALLAEAGVGWVVVQSGSAGDFGRSEATVDRLTQIYRDDEIALYRVPDAVPVATPAHRSTLIAAHLLWLALLLGSAAVAAVCRLKPGLGPGLRPAR